MAIFCLSYSHFWCYSKHIPSAVPSLLVVTRDHRANAIAEVLWPVVYSYLNFMHKYIALCLYIYVYVFYMRLYILCYIYYTKNILVYTIRNSRTYFMTWFDVLITTKSVKYAIGISEKHIPGISEKMITLFFLYLDCQRNRYRLVAIETQKNSSRTCFVL